MCRARHAPGVVEVFGVGAEAAVDIQHGAGHKRGAGAGEEYDAGGDFFRGAVALQRVLGALGFGERAAVFGFMEVSTGPGCSKLTVMPRCPRSRAAPLL